MKPVKAPVAALLCALVVVAAGAADRGRQEIQVIRAEKAFTGRGFVEDVFIVIADGVIREVVPAGAYTAIEGSRLIDAAGLTVTPGLIDSHVHLFGLPLETMKKTAQRGWGRVAEEMVSLVPGNREQYLQSGITTVIDMGSTVDGTRRLADGLGSGRLLGPDLYYCGPLFTAPNGHPAGTIYRGQHDLIDHATVQEDEPGPAAARVAELAGQGVSFIKLVYDDGTSYGGKVPRLDRELAARIAAEAHARGLPVIAHVGALESGFADMIACGVDGVEHCFAYDGSDAVFREAAARGVFFTPTLSIYEIHARALLPRMMESVARAPRGRRDDRGRHRLPHHALPDGGRGFLPRAGAAGGGGAVPAGGARGRDLERGPQDRQGRGGRLPGRRAGREPRLLRGRPPGRGARPRPGPRRHAPRADGRRGRRGGGGKPQGAAQAHPHGLSVRVLRPALRFLGGRQPAGFQPAGHRAPPSV